MKKIKDYCLKGYIQDGYLTINIYDISDDEISWAWSNQRTNRKFISFRNRKKNKRQGQRQHNNIY